MAGRTVLARANFPSLPGCSRHKERCCAEATGPMEAGDWLAAHGREFFISGARAITIHVWSTMSQNVASARAMACIVLVAFVSAPSEATAPPRPSHSPALTETTPRLQPPRLWAALGSRW